MSDNVVSTTPEPNAGSGVGRRIAFRVTVAFAVLVIVGWAWFSTAVHDDLTGWQATPMAPDPALSAAARSSEVCQRRSHFLNATPPPPLASPLQVALQDRRTARTAAFVVTTAAYVGACLLSPATEGAGGLYEEPLRVMADAIAIDGWTEGGLVPLMKSSDWGQYSLYWGRADARVASVRIELGGPLHEIDDDDRVVVATVGGGYWLAWWTPRADRPARAGDNQPRAITGSDVQGTTVVALELRDHGYGSDLEWVAR